MSICRCWAAICESAPSDWSLRDMMLSFRCSCCKVNCICFSRCRGVSDEGVFVFVTLSVLASADEGPEDDRRGFGPECEEEGALSLWVMMKVPYARQLGVKLDFFALVAVVSPPPTEEESTEGTTHEDDAANHSANNRADGHCGFVRSVDVDLVGNVAVNVNNGALSPPITTLVAAPPGAVFITRHAAPFASSKLA
ncbi:hypothetical protein B0H14DRAFT_3571553 [Mycena olivaceomarginata]|nr:hypothetical protein B0H14DRAFT_3571553 [Mycena olivaceomarginata]